MYVLVPLINEYVPVEQIACKREVASLNDSRLALAPVGNAIEFVKIVYNNSCVAASLVVRVGVILVLVRRFQFRGKEWEVEV